MNQKVVGSEVVGQGGEWSKDKIVVLDKMIFQEALAK